MIAEHSYTPAELRDPENKSMEALQYRNLLKTLDTFPSVRQAMRIVGRVLAKNADGDLNTLDLVQKIELYIEIAEKKNIKIPRRVNKIVNILHKHRLGEISQVEIEKRFSQKSLRSLVMSVLVFVVGVASVPSFIRANDSADKRDKVTFGQEGIEGISLVEVDQSDDQEDGYLKYGHDLQAILSDPGVDIRDFLAYYDENGLSEVWDQQELLTALKAEQPRYWGYYVVLTPGIFKESMKKSSEAELVEFFQTGDVGIFLSDYENWSGVWTREQILSAIKTTEPNWIQHVAGHSEIFAGLLSVEEGDLSLLISYLYIYEEYHYFWGEYNPDDWVESWSDQQFFEASKEVYDLEFMVSHPNIFSGSLGAEDLTRVLTILNTDFFFGYYSDGWCNTWSPAQVEEALKTTNPDNWQLIINDHPLVFERSLMSLEEILATEARDFILDNFHEDGWGKRYSVEELLETLKELNPGTDYLKLIRSRQALFGEAVGEEELFAFLVDYDETEYFIETIYLNEGWNEAWSNQELLDAFKKQELKWGTYVLAYPEIFREITREEDLVEIFENGLTGSLLYYYDEWSDLWSPEQILEVFKDQDPGGWGYEVGTHPEIFKTLIVSEIEGSDSMTVLENIIGAGGGYLLNYYDEWSDLWPPDQILEVLKNERDNWGYHIVDKSHIFGELIERGELEILLKDNSSGFLKNYQDGWDEKWTPDEVFVALKEAKPDVWGTYVTENYKIFSEVIDHDDLAEILKAAGGYDLVNNYNQGWNKLWSLEEILMTLMEVRPDRWDGNISSYPELFGAVAGKVDLSEVIELSGVDTFLGGYEEGWDQSWTRQEVLVALKDIRPDTWGKYVFTNSSFFLELIQAEDLRDLIRTSEDSSLTSYEGWEELWTVKEIYVALREARPDDWGEHVIKNSHSFSGLLLKEDLKDLLRTSGDESVMDFSGWEELWTVKEIYVALREARPDDWGVYALKFFEDFGGLTGLLRKEDLKDLLRTSGNYSFNRCDGWEELWTAEEAYVALREAKPDDWGAYFMSHAPIFKDFIEEGDLESLLETNGYDGLIYDYESWEEKWPKERLLAALKTVYPDTWGEYVIGNDFVIESALEESELELMMEVGGLPSLVANYDFIEDLLPPERLLATLKIVYPDSWTEIVFEDLSIFKGVVTIEDLTFLLDKDVVGFFDNYQFPESPGWKKLWPNPEDIIDALKKTDISWGQYVFGHPEIFRDVIEADDLDSIEEGSYALVANYYSWKHLWTPEEVLTRVKEDYGDFSWSISDHIDIFKDVLSEEDLAILLKEETEDFLRSYFDSLEERWSSEKLLDELKEARSYDWGKHVINNPEIFKDLINKEDLSLIIEHEGDWVLVNNYDLWRDVWSLKEIYATLKEIQPDRWGSLVTSNPEIFKDLVSAEDLSDLLTSFGGMYLFNEYNNGWSEVWSPGDILDTFDELGWSPVWPIFYNFHIFKVEKERILKYELVDLLKDSDSSTFDDYYDEGLDKLWNLEEIYVTLKEAKPDDWGFSVGLQGEIFIDIVKHDDLQEILRANGATAIISRYDETWHELWSPEEVFIALKEAKPDNWLPFVTGHPEVFGAVVGEEDLVSFMEDAGVYYFLSKYKDGWDQSWTPEQVLEALKELGSDDPESIQEFIDEYPEIFGEILEGATP